MVTSCSTSDMKYGRIPRRSTMFIAPFTNLRDFNIIFCSSNLFFNQHVGSRNNLQILPRPNFERKKYSLFSLGLVWGGDEPDDVLKGEPTDENRFSNLKEIFLP